MALVTGRDITPLQLDPLHFAFGATPEDQRAWKWHDADECLTWRILRPEDLHQLKALWAKMDADLGTVQDKPDQFAMPVLVTLVAVDDTTGDIVSAVYAEAVADFTMVGTSRRAARSVKTVVPHLSIHLWARSIRIVRVLAPKRLRRHMARLLPGFTDISDSFAQFVHKIRR